ncbi:MAG: hypothetical protein DHS20C05_25300 [Hyphococcus sp.]|nr:MAG: hypothetical protein DHS20C05_25300 [Marinicaulis sp.]
MQNLIEPNIHPMLVHFAYALTVTGALSLFVVSLSPTGGWRDTLKSAGDWMLAFGAIAIVFTVAAGFQAYYSVDHDGPSHAAMTTHRNWAVPTAIAILVLSVWRWMKRKNRPPFLFSVLLLAAAASLSVTAWWGGNLVYGHGLGVSRMPMVTGEGHDHEHAPGEGHGDETETKETAGHDNSDGHHDNDAAPDTPVPDVEAASDFDVSAYPETPEGVVDAYAAALRAGDEPAVRAMLAQNVIIAEGGGAERSVEEYAGHHMPADMAFTAAVDFSRKNRDVIVSEDIATVISESQVHGEFRGEPVHSRMMETMVLRRIDERWRIVHIHWSSAPLTGEHEH